MKHHAVRPRPLKSARNRAVKPVLEGLEGRILLYSTTGDHFQFGSRITWSIVPDGTNLGGVTSNLVSTLDGRFGAGNWQKSLQDAFAIWENVANVNLVEVSDDGSPVDSGSYQQGAPNFGDIRIGGYAQSSGILGFTILPPPADGSSDSGDILLNSAQPWQMGNTYDLETVMVHEIGHALGMGHSTDTSAAMYPYYSGVKQYVDPDDTSGIQSIWGPRQEDGFALGNSNFTSSHAADVSSFVNPQDQIILGPLDVASSSESYWFKVTTPSNASNVFSVVAQSTNLSELSPKVQVYNSNLQGLVQASASTGAYGAIIGVSVTNATPNTTYYIKVSGSTAGPNGTGAYGLLINMGNTNPPLVAPPNTQILNQADQGGGGIYEGTGGTPTPGGGSSQPTPSIPNGEKVLLELLKELTSGIKLPPAIQALVARLEGAYDWESGTVTAATGTPGGTPISDPSDSLTLSEQTYTGDYLLTTPPPSAPAAAASIDPDSALLIPLDPSLMPVDGTLGAPKKSAPGVRVGQVHPVGLS